MLNAGSACHAAQQSAPVHSQWEPMGYEPRPDGTPFPQPAGKQPDGSRHQPAVPVQRMHSAAVQDARQAPGHSANASRWVARFSDMHRQKSALADSAAVAEANALAAPCTVAAAGAQSSCSTQPLCDTVNIAAGNLAAAGAHQAPRARSAPLAYSLSCFSRPEAARRASHALPGLAHAMESAPALAGVTAARVSAGQAGMAQQSGITVPAGPANQHQANASQQGNTSFSSRFRKLSTEQRQRMLRTSADAPMHAASAAAAQHTPNIAASAGAHEASAMQGQHLAPHSRDGHFPVASHAGCVSEYSGADGITNHGHVGSMLQTPMAMTATAQVASADTAMQSHGLQHATRHEAPAHAATSAAAPGGVDKTAFGAAKRSGESQPPARQSRDWEDFEAQYRDAEEFQDLAADYDLAEHGAEEPGHDEPDDLHAGHARKCHGPGQWQQAVQQMPDGGMCAHAATGVQAAAAPPPNQRCDNSEPAQLMYSAPASAAHVQSTANIQQQSMEPLLDAAGAHPLQSNWQPNGAWRQHPPQPTAHAAQRLSQGTWPHRSASASTADLLQPASGLRAAQSRAAAAQRTHSHTEAAASRQPAPAIAAGAAVSAQPAHFGSGTTMAGMLGHQPASTSAMQRSAQNSVPDAPQVCCSHCSDIHVAGF